MTKHHTPGPWNITEKTKHGTIIMGEEGMVLHTHLTDGNAALIAASPALLEALELALAGEQHDHLCDYAMSFTRVRIADGRTLRGRKTYEALVNQCERDAEPCNCWVSKAKAAIAAAKGGAR